MQKTQTANKNTEWNPIGMSYNGRPKSRWKDEVLNDLKELKEKGWAYSIRDRKTLV
jgi:hypothetical protein